MKSQSRKKQCLILEKACARNGNGKASLGKMEAREWGSRLSSTDKNRPAAEPLLFFLSIYFGFFKAIIKKKLYNQYKKVAILEKSLKENIPLELNFQNFC